MRRTVIGAVAALTWATPAVAASTVLSDRADTDLTRAAFTALPSVYRLEATFRVRVAAGTEGDRPVDQVVRISGVAFALAPGTVVTARAVVNPGNGELHRRARALYLQDHPDQEPVTLSTSVRRGATFTLSPAPIPGAVAATEAAAVSGAAALTATLTDGADTDELALLRIDGARAPALPLRDGQTPGTPAVTVTFDALGRAIATTGTLEGVGEDAETQRTGFTVISHPVTPSDYGGPVLDADGAVRGVVVPRQVRDDQRAVIASSGSLRGLLPPPAPDPSAVSTRFRDAMTAFWRNDFSTAARLLDPRPGDAPLIAHERARAIELAGAAYAVSGPSRLRAAILAVGAMATACAAILGALLLYRREPV